MLKYVLSCIYMHAYMFLCIYICVIGIFMYISIYNISESSDKKIIKEEGIFLSDITLQSNIHIYLYIVMTLLEFF